METNSSESTINLEEGTIEIEVEEEIEEVIPFQYSITSYGADYVVDSLVRRISEGDIYIPIFQRGYVWNMREASYFIESLLLGLPVPGIFLSKEEATQKLLVIDGQQRLRTLQYFYGGIFADSGKEFALNGIQEKFNGKTYKTLEEEDRRRLNDSILHATIIKQEKPSEDDSSIYHIFERLNTTSSQLRPQEIRACIYHGPFNDLLRDLNKNEYWRSMFGDIDDRMRDQELILRFIALYFLPTDYQKTMKGFLNHYMGANREFKKNPQEEIKIIFQKTINAIIEGIGVDAFKPKGRFMAALFDAIMVGVANRLKVGEVESIDLLKKSYEQLLLDNEFIRAIETHTSDKDNVMKRIDLAIKAFSAVK